MKHRFHVEAFREYAEAVSHYESRQAGLGARFVNNVEHAIDAICQTPERWPVLEQDIHRRLTRVFPYAILYSIERDFILILAVMHCHQKPGYWQDRAKR